jgi:excisionase family DNA binding protein
LNDLPISMKAKDVAAYLNVSQRYAYELMERSDFPTIRYGRCKRVLREDFLQWVQKQKTTA